MSYSTWRWNNYGLGSCAQGECWDPKSGLVGDSNNPTRNDISNAYLALFGRYGEKAGVEGYVSTWVYGKGQELYDSIQDMVQRGGDENQGGSGEWNRVQGANGGYPGFGKHTRLEKGSCPFPIPGCTDPSASNYNPNATVNDGSCSYPPPPPPPIPGCTDPNASNYNPNATVNNGSCLYPSKPYVFYNGIWVKSKNVYIRDGESWKLCRDVYIRDGGSWKRSIN
jgi:hypothetical protein